VTQEISPVPSGDQLDGVVEQVRQFHRHIGAPVAARPCLLPCSTEAVNRLAVQLLELSLVVYLEGAAAGDQVLARLALTLEEISEWLFAHSRGDLVAAADAWADRLYVLLGNAVATDLPAEFLFREIHRSNMTKEPGQRDWPGKAVRGRRFSPLAIKDMLKDATATNRKSWREKEDTSA